MNARGQALVEYALILALVGCVCIVVLNLLGHKVSDAFGCALQFAHTANCR